MRISSDEVNSLCLELYGVSAGYGSSPVTHDVSFSAPYSEITAIVGPNGAGKSTLLKAITGILRPAAGTIRLDSEDVSGLRPDEIARRGLGYMPQVNNTFASLSVIENLEMGGYMLPRNRVEGRVEEVLERFPVLKPLRKQSVGRLSGGEQKLVALGRVLMTRPGLLVLDEPTAGLSPKLAHEFLNQRVTDIAVDGTAVLLVEQRVTEALGVASSAVVLVDGMVEVIAPGSELLERDDLGRAFLGTGGRAL